MTYKFASSFLLWVEKSVGEMDPHGAEVNARFEVQLLTPCFQHFDEPKDEYCQKV